MSHTVSNTPIKCPVCSLDAMWIGDDFESAETIIVHASKECRISSHDWRAYQNVIAFEKTRKEA